MVGINERVKCFKDLAVDAFIVHRCSQRKKPLEVLREFLQNKEKRFYIIYRFFIAKNRRHQKSLVTTNFYYPRRNSLDENLWKTRWTKWTD